MRHFFHGLYVFEGLLSILNASTLIASILNASTMNASTPNVSILNASTLNTSTMNANTSKAIVSGKLGQIDSTFPFPPVQSY